jgi:uncharacterized protein YxeA
MKVVLIVVVTLLVLFIIGQLWISLSSKNIEQHSYKVVENFDEENVEIREYESANFAYVTMPASSYEESSSKGFRMLAGYIFGGNETGEKIAMTSPVKMTMEDSVTMQFMVPERYSLEDLPTPESTAVRFKKEEGKTMAAIRFGGWASDKKIEEHSSKLRDFLEQEGITHLDNFSYLGYNPPYQLFNRRNEVVVEVAYDAAGAKSE